MIHIYGLLTVLFALHADVVLSQSVCGRPVVWRNSNITCPPRAVCADVFTAPRDWYNGTRCQETRVLSNCICPNNQVCPFDNPQHMLYASTNQRQFFCEPVCNVPWCANVQQSRDPLRGSSNQNQRRRTPLVVAITTEQNASNFEGKTYYKISCRCPRHHFPVSTRGRRSRAVRAYRYQFNYTLRRYVTQYICNVRPNEEPREDPCA